MEQPNNIAGVDEAGRGPLAGAVVAAAVILSPEQPIEGLADSKKLTEKTRERLFDEIMAKALSVGVGRSEPEEIDRINILQATLCAMQRAVAALSAVPVAVWVDGNQPPRLAFPTRTIIKGDQKVKAISAASIIAKVIRDREMIKFAQIYPEYGFDRHKGYPTKAHCLAIEQHGVLPIHRKSFGPVARLCYTEAF